MNHQALRAAAAALLLALPLASHALHVCTDANGKSSFQDKPCEARAAAPQFTPLKAPALTDANALETMNRLTGAMNARDVDAMQRMLARGFESRISRKADEHIVLDANQFGQFMTRALQAARSYRIQRTCRRDPAGDSADALALRCSYADKLEMLNRVVNSQGDEFMRVTLQNGEIKLLEMSEAIAADALRNRKLAQAPR
jgi:hypothetical protein